MGKTKVMRSCDETSPVVKSGKYPCRVCSKGVDANAIEFTSCHTWIHNKCSGISGTFKHVDDCAREEFLRGLRLICCNRFR